MERISAFMDGESTPAETRDALLHLKQDIECNETFATFHLIGDAMRGEPVLSDNFMSHFHAQIESEPTVLAPRRFPKKHLTLALSAAASLSAVALVTMLAVVDNPLRIASISRLEPADSSSPLSRPVTVVNQGKVNEYLMAHQEYSPSTALQGVAPYVRTVSDTHDGNNR
jgi:sigma-E factor negative regulatory protein RseA